MVCFAAMDNQSAGNASLPAPFPRFSSLHALLPLPPQPVLQPHMLSSDLACCALSRASKPLSLPFPLPGPFIFPSPVATLSSLRMSPRPSSETSHSRGLSPPQFGLATAPHPHEVSHGSVLIFLVVLTTLHCNGPILAFC